MSESPWTAWPERGPVYKSTTGISARSTGNFKLGSNVGVRIQPNKTMQVSEKLLHQTPIKNRLI